MNNGKHCIRLFHLVAIRYSRQATFFIFHFSFFITHYSFTFAQTPTREQLVGTWIGVHTEWDLDFACALPIYIQLDADSTYHLGMVDGSASKLTSTWSILGESVRLDTIHFAPRLVSLQNELLRIGTNYPMVFRRFNDIPLDSATVYEQLNGRIWQSDSLTISLFANGQASLENTLAKQRTAHFWQLAQFSKSIFLIIRGNQHNRDSGYKALWQINSVSSKQLQAIGWNGCKIAAEPFRLVRNLSPGDSCRPSGFQTCDNCFRQLWAESTLTRGQKRYDIVQLFTKYYQPVNQTGESGLVRIQFVVNCEGERGLVEINGFDEDYCPRQFDPRITNQLSTICSEHIATDQSIRQSDSASGLFRDISISLAFRLKDGRITEILP
ncbi:hypothetical protein GO730_21600 [Spirosoma sp. HMF3257]|uniref:Uncharacterized protein n=1 Tax=Spirosoma telluris TaxID=2183553 RepID=A0A327NLT1_9BACT|nr:hypothetical protein [Spirosoma telluris]RAI76117.1 hypothetical protein HMF3257_21520 [Spirosoma telluris]